MAFASRSERIAHTHAEKELHKLLVMEPFPVPLKTQAPEGRCRLDFFFPDWKLAVEIDGPWHAENPEADKNRDDGLAKMGIAVLRLPADMPAVQMRRHVAYVSQRILCLSLAEKIQFVRGYKTDVLDHLVTPDAAKPKPSLTPNPLCLDCDGSGWRLVPVFSEVIRQAEMRATRCQCKNLRSEAELQLSGEEWFTELRERLERKPPQQAVMRELFTKTA